MTSWLKIFLLLHILSIASISLSSEQCSPKEKELIALMDAGSDDLGRLTHTNIWKEIISSPTPEKFDRAIEIVKKANQHLGNPGQRYESLFSYISKFDDDKSTKDYLIGLLTRCLEKYLKNCQKGFHQITDLKNKTELSVPLYNYDIDVSGKLKIPDVADSNGKKIKPVEVTVNNGGLSLDEFRTKAILLSDNLAEAGNIKVREGVGAVRYMQRNPDKILRNYDHPNASDAKVDFIDQEGRTYQLKGPFTTDDYGSLYAHFRKHAADKGLDPERFIFESVVNSAINSITKKGFMKTGADVVLVDLLGHPPGVRKYIKKEVIKKYNDYKLIKSDLPEIEWVD
tara:strand:- start:10617 stop:11639 length:1023 start_codon:yes stop_codon:yes gene_type:complete